MNLCILRKWTITATIALLIGCVGSVSAQAAKKPDFPSLDVVTKGYEKVVSTADGKKSLYTIWTRKKDGQMLAALPSSYARQKHFIAMTIASGDKYAGLQAGDMYVYWKRFDKRIALIQPNTAIRSTGDMASKSSIKRLFTDRVLLDLPIVAMMGNSPVIDLDALLVGQASKFFGSKVRVSNSRLITIKKAKAFPGNVEIAFEVPTSRGTLQTLHYSISSIPDNTGYRPRKADERIGYFTTSYKDLGKFKQDETNVRYINRWKLEKADSSLELSPPKEPIVFYIEHTTPVRYRRWVRQGILFWNKAFEKVGLTDAIEVYYQDASTGAHMDKDPEDVRYNFVRWLSNNQGTAIGPSRVHPLTGQILDADIILTDGWIRHFWLKYNKIMPQVAMEGFSPETLSWLSNHPEWDPRVRLAPPGQRDFVAKELIEKGKQSHGGHPVAHVDSHLIGDDEYDGLSGRVSQVNGMCQVANCKAFDMAMMSVHMSMLNERAAVEGNDGVNAKDKDNKDKKDKEAHKCVEGVKCDCKKVAKAKPKKKETMIDGMPESFIGPMLADLVCHEVGHTLGLRHNFKASSLYTLKEINSEEIKGKKPLASSVMDYIGVNMNLDDGPVQGDYTMIGVGPYDYWAIEYGYTFAKDLKPVVGRAAEPELQYATDEDTWGPDPLARRYDYSKNPLDYANNQMKLVSYHRESIVEKFVKDGESWGKARQGYELTLSMQVKAISMMSNWVGGSFVYRDKKGDKNGRAPIEVVPVKAQREALNFVIDHSFKDDAFGLTQELLSRMTVDKWWDDKESIYASPTWPVHDKIMGIQASALTMLLNPTTLSRIYDNEFRVPDDKDAITLPELMSTVSDSIWTELKKPGQGPFTNRSPMISSMRRNLQREHLDRLIDLALTSNKISVAYKPISDLSLMQLRELGKQIDNVVKKYSRTADAYTKAHLKETNEKIKKVFSANYSYKEAKRPSIFSFF